MKIPPTTTRTTEDKTLKEILKMNREELIATGDASVRKALANMYAILNGEGNILSKMRDGEKMMFSPRLECDGDCSTILFDDEDKANGVIEEILVPQYGEGEYHVYKFTSLGDSPCSSDDGNFPEEMFEIDSDEYDGSDDGCDDDIEGDFADDDCECDWDDIEDEDIDCAIADASAEGDEQLVAWLEELKAYRASDRFGNEIEESVGKCPTMREAQKIFKRNGYQLVSQRGSHQKWVKEGDRIPIILPYHSRDNEQVRPGDWKTIVKEHNLRLDV